MDELHIPTPSSASEHIPLFEFHRRLALFLRGVDCVRLADLPGHPFWMSVVEIWEPRMHPDERNSSSSHLHFLVGTFDRRREPKSRWDMKLYDRRYVFHASGKVEVTETHDGRPSVISVTNWKEGVIHLFQHLDDGLTRLAEACAEKSRQLRQMAKSLEAELES
jgi:hypothetical protein